MSVEVGFRALTGRYRQVPCFAEQERRKSTHPGRRPRRSRIRKRVGNLGKAGLPARFPFVLAFSPTLARGQVRKRVRARWRSWPASVSHHTREALILAQRGSQRAEGGAGDLVVLSPVRLWGTSRCRGRAEAASNLDSRMWFVRESRR